MLVVLLGLRTFGRSYSMTRWPITPGRILRSAVTPTDNGQSRALIEYEFILAGRVYRGVMTSGAAADSLVAAYPPGREIPVGYDPGDPQQSVLRPQIRWWSLALTVAGAIVLFVVGRDAYAHRTGRGLPA